MFLRPAESCPDNASSLERRVFLVLNNDNDLCYGSLHILSAHETDRVYHTGKLAGRCWSFVATHLHQFFSHRLHRARDVFIQSRMSRLEDWGIIFLSPNKEVGGVYLSNIEYGVDRDFHCRGDDIRECEDGDEGVVGMLRRRNLGVQGI